MKILIAGEGGQGIQLMAELLAKAAFNDGFDSLYIPNFGVEQRGGVSIAYVTIDKKAVAYPKFEKADILAILCNRAIERINNYLNPKTLVIFGPAVTRRTIVNLSDSKIFLIKSAWFPPKVWNLLVLGKIIKLTRTVSLKTLKKVMNEKLMDKFAKDPSLKELDEKALSFNK